jgi:hypothetical protein
MIGTVGFRLNLKVVDQKPLSKTTGRHAARLRGQLRTVCTSEAFIFLRILAHRAADSARCSSLTSAPRSAMTSWSAAASSFLPSLPYAQLRLRGEASPAYSSRLNMLVLCKCMQASTDSVQFSMTRTPARLTRMAQAGWICGFFMQARLWHKQPAQSAVRHPRADNWRAVWTRRRT